LLEGPIDLLLVHAAELLHDVEPAVGLGVLFHDPFALGLGLLLGAAARQGRARRRGSERGSRSQQAARRCREGTEEGGKGKPSHGKGPFTETPGRSLGAECGGAASLQAASSRRRTAPGISGSRSSSSGRGHTATGSFA